MEEALKKVINDSFLISEMDIAQQQPCQGCFVYSNRGGFKLLE